MTKETYPRSISLQLLFTYRGDQPSSSLSIMSMAFIFAARRAMGVEGRQTRHCGVCVSRREGHWQTFCLPSLSHPVFYVIHISKLPLSQHLPRRAAACTHDHLPYLNSPPSLPNLMEKEKKEVRQEEASQGWAGEGGRRRTGGGGRRMDMTPYTHTCLHCHTCLPLHTVFS